MATKVTISRELNITTPNIGGIRSSVRSILRAIGKTLAANNDHSGRINEANLQKEIYRAQAQIAMMHINR